MSARVQRFQDQIEAAGPEQAFWHQFSDSTGPITLDGHPHRGEGGSTTLIYRGAQLLGISSLSRDPMNWTVLVCVDLRPRLKKSP